MAQPFQIHISEEIITDLNNRIAATRWPDEFDNDKWEWGTNGAYLEELCNYWRSSFNWKTQEAQINSLSHFKAEIDGLNIHFIHEKGKGTTTG